MSLSETYNQLVNTFLPALNVSKEAQVHWGPRLENRSAAAFLRRRLSMDTSQTASFPHLTDGRARGTGICAPPTQL